MGDEKRKTANKTQAWATGKETKHTKQDRQSSRLYLTVNGTATWNSKKKQN
jgi:hypothetical protein